MLYSPSTLGRIVYKNRWLEPPHIKFLDELLVSVARRELRRLIVNIPPRFGKSELISKLFPFWYIGNFTNHTVMVVSYQNNLAREWGKRIRELIIEYGESLFSITLDRADRSASSIRVLPGGGKIYCVGAGGLLTGLGANAIVIDDPIKNQKEALSLRQRDSLWDWFKATLFTRLEPDGVLILVMTRWHDDDIVGRILKSNEFVEIKKDGLNKNLGKENSSLWFLVKIPVIAGQKDPLGRKPGELLWESRFGRESVLEQKRILGNFWFSALYQQEPIFETGRVFKVEKFRYFSIENNLIIVEKITNREVKKEYHRIEDCSIFATVDLAIKEKEQSDYTVAVVFAVSTNREIFILEVERKKIEATGHLDFLFQIFSRWKPTVIGIESVQYQYSLIQMAMHRGLPVKELRPDKDKFARALAISALMESEMVYFRRDARWLEDFEQELLQFPYGNHDDQVDAFSYIPRLIEPLSFSRVVGVARKSEVDKFKIIR